MKYPEEGFAKDLHARLKLRFATTVPDATASVEGAGVHWKCRAQRGDLRCDIHCFGGPQYYTELCSASEEIATIRIPSAEQTLSIVEEWVRGTPLASLHERYSFIDREKRGLSSIRDAVLVHAPTLTSVTVELNHVVADMYEMWFRTAERSSRLSYYGKNEFADARFYWDDCELFRFAAADSEALAAVLKRWLCDSAMPSSLRTEFPWLETGKLADYYEAGNPIEGEFLVSWDGIQRFYDEFDYPKLLPVNQFLVQLRHAGYDKKLRAGQSMTTLILSRSRRHGLREDQPFVAFIFRNRTMDVVPTRLNVENLNRVPIEVSEPLRALLDVLVQHATD